MDPAATEVFGSIPQLVTMGIAVFLAVSLAIQKIMEGQKSEKTHVSIITEDRDAWRDRARRFQEENDQIQEKLNTLIVEQSDMKAQNAVMAEQINNLRKENQELLKRLERLMRIADVNESRTG